MPLNLTLVVGDLFVVEGIAFPSKQKFLNFGKCCNVKYLSSVNKIASTASSPSSFPCATILYMFLHLVISIFSSLERPLAIDIEKRNFKPSQCSTFTILK
ncbi:unnamed protein product, partial [Vitis vinifera]